MTELGARSFEQGRAAMSQPSTSVDQSPAVEGPSPRASFGPIAAPAAQQELLVVRPQAQPQQVSQTLVRLPVCEQATAGPNHADVNSKGNVEAAWVMVLSWPPLTQAAMQ